MAVAIINATVACRRPDLDWMGASTLIRLRCLANPLVRAAGTSTRARATRDPAAAPID
jgi:hypothetical protein